MQNCDLIIKGKYILPMDNKMNIVNNGMVVVDKNKILDIGKTKELKEKYQAEETLNCGNSIIMPGLINTHTHAAMAYFRGLADDLPLSEWLEKHIWPAEAKYIKPDFVRKACELACLEMIKSGVTCFNDMYFFEEITAQVTESSGMRAVVGEGILDFSTPSCKTPDDAINKTRELIIKYRKSELIRVAYAPHSIYTCSRRTLEKVADKLKENDCLIHIHISETRKEARGCKKDHDQSPVEYLDKLGLLSKKTVAAHSIWLDEKDLGIYKNRGVKVSHCPISNMKLASGVAPVDKMIKQGIEVGLGTDGAASNNTLDLLSDMRACALLHKVSNLDSTLINSYEVVKMATISAAKALGLDNIIGSLESGKQADIITINLDKPSLQPLYNPYSHLVYCAEAQDIDNVVINGRVIMKNKEVKTVNEERVLADVKKFKIN